MIYSVVMRLYIASLYRIFKYKEKYWPKTKPISRPRKEASDTSPPLTNNTNLPVATLPPLKPPQIFCIFMQVFHSTLTNLVYYLSSTLLNGAQRTPLYDVSFQVLPLLTGALWHVSDIFIYILITTVVLLGEAGAKRQQLTFQTFNSSLRSSHTPPSCITNTLHTFFHSFPLAHCSSIPPLPPPSHRNPDVRHFRRQEVLRYPRYIAAVEGC